MTQKPLGKKAVFDAKKAKVANRHGKVHKQRKGESPLLAPLPPRPSPASHTCAAHTQAAVTSPTPRSPRRTRTCARCVSLDVVSGRPHHTRHPPHARGCAPGQEITRLINQRNEQDFARKASQSGGSLAVVRLVSWLQPPLPRWQASFSPPCLTRLSCWPPQLRPPPDKASAGKGKHFLKPNLKTAAQL